MAQNLKRMFFALDRAMLEAHREDRDEYAEDTARVLLGYPELPLLIRARACMVLGCSGVADDALDMAKEAVRIAELGVSLLENPDKIARQLLADSRTVLSEVQAAHAQRAVTEGELEEDSGELFRGTKSEEATQEGAEENVARGT